jgi:hypothetical protein
VRRKKTMAQNILLGMAKTLEKGNLNPDAMVDFERFMLARLIIPDRVSTMLAATNVESCPFHLRLTQTAG